MNRLKLLCFVCLASALSKAESGAVAGKPNSQGVQSVQFDGADIGARRKAPSINLIEQYKLEAIVPSFEWHFFMDEQIHDDLYGSVSRRIDQ